MRLRMTGNRGGENPRAGKKFQRWVEEQRVPATQATRGPLSRLCTVKCSSCTVYSVVPIFPRARKHGKGREVKKE
jgi:hypothetical protein